MGPFSGMYKLGVGTVDPAGGKEEEIILQLLSSPPDAESSIHEFLIPLCFLATCRALRGVLRSPRAPRDKCSHLVSTLPISLSTSHFCAHLGFPGEYHLQLSA